MPNVCIVVPCYNEEKRLPLADFIDFIQNTDEICFCFVDDGSKDDTFKVLNSIKERFPQKAEAIRNRENSGKAESVRNGVNFALGWQSFDYIGYFDADLATPLEEIFHLLHYVKPNRKFEFALGSRIQRLGTEIHRNTLRHYVGRVFASMASMVLKMPVYDTQCGAKLISSSIAREIFDRPFISRWLFDVELIARVKQLHPVDLLIEVPVDTWIEKGDSRIKLSDLFKLPFELLKIKWAY